MPGLNLVNPFTACHVFWGYIDIFFLGHVQDFCRWKSCCVMVCVYIYIYFFIFREREREMSQEISCCPRKQKLSKQHLSILTHWAQPPQIRVKTKQSPHLWTPKRIEKKIWYGPTPIRRCHFKWFTYQMMVSLRSKRCRIYFSSLVWDLEWWDVSPCDGCVWLAYYNWSSHNWGPAYDDNSVVSLCGLGHNLSWSIIRSHRLDV